MKLIALFLLLISPLLALAQTSRLDSLKAELSKNHPDSERSKVFNNLFLELAFKDNENAFAYLDSAILLAERNNDSRAMGRYYNNKGVVSLRSGQLRRAMNFLLEGVNHAEANQDSSTLLKLYGNMAHIFMIREEQEQAEKYYDKILLYCNPETEPIIYLKTLNNKGLLLKREEQYEKALEWFAKAKMMAENQRDSAELANVLNNIGITQYHMADRKKAERNYREAIKINKKVGHQYQLVTNYLNLGNLLLEDELITEAKQTASLALKLAQSEKYLEETSSSQELLYRVNKAEGNLKEALAYLEAYKESLDEFNQEKYSKDVASMEAEFDSEQKSQEILRLRQNEDFQHALLEKQQVQITLVTVILVFLVIILLVSYYLYRVKEKANAVLETKNQKIETLIRELHHRVKNNLQIVNSLLNLQYNRVTDEGTKQAIREGQSRLEAMSLIHKNLYMDEDFTGLDIKAYLDFLTQSLAVSYGFPVDAVKSDIDLENPIFNLDQAVPLGLIVNELASNAFKHAFENKELAQLMVEIKEEKQKISFKLKDNGKGFSEELNPLNESSFGLKLVTTLIEQLDSELVSKGKEGSEFSFEFVRK
ncbi:tetratricopeptide repeat-containing sensor histidine kinase [Pararhodonellum marinum]|uniref:tetratricopeptide repeat-containing sensor histidine kinase n=1 Tax=Pararhodonellum marinum TaxID=2755358 RepID=UPI001890A130|nr:histidine kinase dimerization/phosphoacceptor domain -containing protein [Pararhodonellum marinum]